MNQLTAFVRLATLAALFAGPDALPASDQQIWFTATVQGPAGSPFQGYFEFQPRLGSTGGARDHMILRPALVWDLNQAHSLWLGYGAIVRRNPVLENIENRVFQQWLWRMQAGSWSLAHRTRLEERFLDGVNGVSLRLRYLLRAVHPLGEPVGRPLYLVLADEAFFHLNSASPGLGAGFDQNRLFLGVGVRFREGVSAETGYLLQYLRSPGSPDRLNHVWALSLILQ